MNYKIAKTGLILCIVYLVGFYVLKFSFPHILVQTITSPTMIKLGDFINSWRGFQEIVETLSLFLTFYLFSCASCGRFKLRLYELLSLLVLTVFANTIYYLLPELYTHTTISCMLAIAVIRKGNLFYTACSFVVHGYLTQFLLEIKGFETIMVYFTPISGILINLEVDVWLILLTIIFYIKENKKKGKICTSVCE